jgi:hypothetical protein
MNTNRRTAARCGALALILTLFVLSSCNGIEDLFHPGDDDLVTVGNSGGDDGGSEDGDDTIVAGSDTGDTGNTVVDKPLITYTAEQAYASPDYRTSVQIKLTFSEASAEIENLMMYDVTIKPGTASVTTVSAITGVKTNKTIWLTSVTAPDGGGDITLSIKLKGVETGEKTVTVYQAPGDDPGGGGDPGDGATVAAVLVSPETAGVVKGATIAQGAY